MYIIFKLDYNKGFSKATLIGTQSMTMVVTVSRVKYN